MASPDQRSRPLQLFSKEKIAEFRGMSLEARLAWLEEANALVDLVHGRQKRGQFDERFRDWPESLHAEESPGRQEAGLVIGESKASYAKKKTGEFP
jgi:hypothetical protein